MTIEEIKKKVADPDYDFLRTNEHLGSNIILLGLGGSYSYGTNVETSDLDVRGCALNRKTEILTNQRFDQQVRRGYDEGKKPRQKISRGSNPETQFSRI